MYDIVIIGGGPAGATLARLISNDKKVLLIERTGADNGEKLCGGLIAPDTQRMLGKFGLSLPKDILVDPQMFYVESVDLETNNKQRYQRFYINIDRKKFDNWLLKLVGKNVTVLRDTQYKHHKLENDCITITIEKNGKSEKVNSKILVGADGAHSNVRRKTFNDYKKINKYIAIQSEIDSSHIPPSYKVYFDRNLTDFYGWTIPKDGNNIIGIALKGKGAKQKYEQYLKKVGGKNYKEINRRSTVIIRPKKMTDFKIDKYGRIFFIGEAAGFISPSSAEGFSYAFKSAAALANSINSKNSTEKVYRNSARKIILELTLKRVKSVFIYTKLLRNLIFKLGINKL